MHKLIAVEYGMDIQSAATRLMRDVEEDAAGLEQFQYADHIYVNKPEKRYLDLCRVKRYRYEIFVVFMGLYGEELSEFYYGIVEKESPDIPCVMIE